MTDSLKLFSATLYDVSDNANRQDEWERRSEVYVVSKSLESATSLVKKSISEDEILIGISEMVNAKFLI